MNLPNPYAYRIPLPELPVAYSYSRWRQREAGVLSTLHGHRSDSASAACDSRAEHCRAIAGDVKAAMQ